MQLYSNVNGDSGVVSYEIGAGSITVRFERGGVYLYTDASAGPHHITEMQRLAQAGHGLNTYINRHVRHKFAEKLA